MWFYVWEIKQWEINGRRRWDKEKRKSVKREEKGCNEKRRMREIKRETEAETEREREKEWENSKCRGNNNKITEEGFQDLVVFYCI